MSDEMDLTQFATAALAADGETGSVDLSNDSNPDFLLDLANQDLGIANEALDQETEVAKEEEQVSAEETETTEEADDETPVEAEDDEQEETEPKDDVDEYFEVDYEDAKNGLFPIKINGEVKMMKFGEIQNQLARAESASKKSQEANQRLQELEAREAKVKESESWMTQQQSAYQQSEELVALSNQYNAAEKALDKARKDGNTDAIVKIKDDMDIMRNKYSTIEAEVVETQKKAEEKHLDEQYRILKDKGYEGIVDDQFRKYVETNLSPAAMQAMSYDATLMIALEKAQKWDNSQGKTKRTLKKTKTLTPGGGNIQQSKSNKQEAMRKQMAAGKGSESDALAGIQQIADELFGNS